MADLRPAPSGAGLFAARRHLLGLEGLPAAEILELLEAASAWRERFRRGQLEPTTELAGVTVCNAFFEDSTRTRVSFEVAEQRLGASFVTFTTPGSSVSKGETLLDTLRTITSMDVKLVVLRHPSAGAAAYAARHLPGIGVINGGDGAHEHPTQGLLDLLTLSDAWGGRFEGRRLAIVGDIAHSRVARSAIAGATALGARITVAGPPTLMPTDVESLGVEVASTVEDALEGADAAMALRIQRERMESGRLPSLAEYARAWGLTAGRVARLAPGAPVLHPGPMNRGVEITDEVADGERSVVFRQTGNGVPVRCAVLARCAAALKESA